MQMYSYTVLEKWVQISIPFNLQSYPVGRFSGEIKALLDLISFYIQSKISYCNYHKRSEHHL